MRFVLALHSDDGVKFGVTVPDLKGCFTAGDSIDHAIESAVEAIEAHVELLAEKCEGMPRTSSVQDLREREEFSDVKEWVHVDVPVERFFGPAEKINITVPALTLRRIDKHVQSIGETRSGFLVRAAIRAMEQQCLKTLRDRISQAYADVPVEEGLSEIDAAVAAERQER